MKKRLLIIAASLISACFIAIATVSINRLSIAKTNGETVTYTMTLDKNNRISNVVTNGDKQGVVKTALGSDIEMVYTSTISDPTGQDFLFLDGSTQTLKNKSPINGVSRIDYQVIGVSTIKYSYSYDGQAEPKFIGSDSEQVSGTVTFGDGEGFPSYFEFSTLTSCHIISLKFYYSCTPSVDPHTSTGTWTYASNDDGEGSFSAATLTGYTNPSIQEKNSAPDANSYIVKTEDYNGTVPVFRKSSRLIINVDVFDNCGFKALNSGKITVKDIKQNVVLANHEFTDAEKQASHDSAGNLLNLFKNKPRATIAVDLPTVILDDNKQLEVTVYAEDNSKNQRQIVIPVKLSESSFDTRVIEHRENKQ